MDLNVAGWVQVGPVERRTAGHQAHGEHLDLGPLVGEIDPGLIPVDLSFLRPTVALRHERLSPQRRCCTGPRMGRTTSIAIRDSCNPDGDRASQLQHAVQNMDGDTNLGDTPLVLMKAQTVPDDLFVASDGGLHPLQWH